MNNIDNKTPRIAIFAYSRRGCSAALTAGRCFPDAERRMYTVERFVQDGFLPLGRKSENFYGTLFEWADALIFVGSCGIAVRCIAPYVRDKKTDPAVICIDELGRSVIPLLSGHIGGANDMARRIAASIGADAVITTATDINSRFSVDEWAVKNGLVIGDMKLAKAVSAEILEKDIPFLVEIPKDMLTISKSGERYPEGIIFLDGCWLPEAASDGDIMSGIGIFVSWNRSEPFRKTLKLIPRVLHLGIGCRRGVSEAGIREAVNTVLEENNIDMRAVKSVASIDLKKDEAGLLEYCEKNGWSPIFYSADELRAAQGEFTTSDFVRGVTGVDNVCERAAAAGGARKIIVRKTALNGVTVAVAAEHTEVQFG